MNSYVVGPGIRFNDSLFSEPVPLSNWTGPKCAGLFVVLVRDGNWAPRSFQPLFFGEFGNNVRGPLVASCLRTAANTTPMFVAVLPMPFSSGSQRCDMRDQLVWAYNPIYQGSATPGQSELARKVDELEKRHEETSTQFHLLLASINRLLEPQPVPPHRPIGFLPETADSPA